MQETPEEQNGLEKEEQNKKLTQSWYFGTLDTQYCESALKSWTEYLTLIRVYINYFITTPSLIHIMVSVRRLWTTFHRSSLRLMDQAGNESPRIANQLRRWGKNTRKQSTKQNHFRKSTSVAFLLCNPKNSTAGRLRGSVGLFCICWKEHPENGRPHSRVLVGGQYNFLCFVANSFDAFTIQLLWATSVIYQAEKHLPMAT